MFSKEQLATIKSSGAEGLSLKATASMLKMTYSKFNEAYQESESAQLAFETGQAELELEVVTVAKTIFKGGDKSSFDFLIRDVLNISGKGKVDAPQSKTKRVEIPSMLLALGNLLGVDDEELARKQALKYDEENSKAKPVKNKKDEEEDEQ